MDGIIIQANDKLVIMSEIIMQTKAILCNSCCLHLVEKRRKLCTRAKKNIQGTINLLKVLPSTVVCIMCKKCTTSQKSIIRTQRRKLCERACVRKYSGQDAEPRVCRFPRHSLYSPLPCLVFILYSPRAYTVFLPLLYSSCIRTAPCCICCYICN